MTGAAHLPTFADESIRRAAAAFSRGAPQEAEQLAREVLARDPRHPVAQHMVGVALLVQGRPADAIAPLRAALGLRSDSAVATQLATALRLTGNLAEAEKLLRPIIGQTPPYPAAFHELAALLHTGRRFREANEVAARGLAIAPNLPDLWIVSGMSRLDVGDRAAARAQLAKALSLAPEHPRALLGMGVAWLEDGRFSEAADFLQRAIRTGQAPAQAFLSLAASLLELRRSEEALDCLRRAVAADPGLYPKALKTLVTAGRGQFALKPSDMERLLKP